MGVLAVVVAGSPGPRGGKGESGDGFRRRGGAIRGGIGTGRDAIPGLKAGCTKVVT